MPCGVTERCGSGRRDLLDAPERRNELLLAASFASTLARLGAALDDPDICDDHLLLELLSLADRAENALGRVERRERRA